jgi:hypothetical protein
MVELLETLPTNREWPAAPLAWDATGRATRILHCE